MTIIELVIMLLSEGHTESFSEALLIAQLELSKDLNPDYVAAVDKHFWELV